MNEIFPASSFVTMDDVIEPMESSVDGSATFVNAVNSANTYSNWPSMSFENLPASTIEVAMETMPAVPPPRGKRRSFTNNEEEEKEEEFKLPKLDIEEAKKQNHSEIEKRRRDKMNTYITELSSMIPMCNAMARKLDKLTILRMAVQHMKTIRRSSHSIADDHYKPSLLTDEQIKRLVLAAADGFVFVVGCDRGRILYVSESVSEILHYTQSDLLGQNWFDILHPKDIAKVKEQLSFPDLIPKERFIDAKTMRPVKTDVLYSHSCLQPGARRSFFCRMKCKSESTVKEEADTTTGYHRRKKSQIDRKYCIIHCTGYMKSWPPAKIGLQDDLETEGDGCNLSCLVAVARIQSTLHNLLSDNMLIPTSPLEFVSRLSSDGKFIFVDQRATVLLGYLPQELLGTSCYEYFHQDDIAHIAESHKTVLQNLEEVATRPYRFRTKDGSFICLQGKWRSFRNLWTKEVECLIAVSTLTFHGRGVVESNVIDDTRIPENSVDAMLSVLPSGNISRNNLGPKGADVRIGAGKIGCQIAREVLDVPRNQDSSSSSSPIEIMERFPQSQTTINNMYLTNTYVQEQHKMCHTSLSGSTTTNQMSMSNSKDGCYLVNPVASNSFVHPTTSNNVSGQTWYCGNIHSHSQTSNNFLEQVGFSNSTDANLVCDPLIQHVESMSAASAQPSEGNDEAAMAVIMSLLEADAGLGGPVDFSGLQWPLP